MHNHKNGLLYLYMKNITKRIWETKGQHFVASFNIAQNDFVEPIWVSRGQFDVPLKWEQLTAAEQNEIENHFADLIEGPELVPMVFGPGRPNWENSIESFLCRD